MFPVDFRGLCVRPADRGTRDRETRDRETRGRETRDRETRDHETRDHEITTSALTNTITDDSRTLPDMCSLSSRVKSGACLSGPFSNQTSAFASPSRHFLMKQEIPLFKCSFITVNYSDMQMSR